MIDAKEMYVTPGLIDTHTHLALKADSLGDFYSEHNEKNSILLPRLRAVDAINPQMKTIKEARDTGVTLCATGSGSVNINSDRVMGVGEKYGSLEKGTIADIVIWAEKPFVMMQNPIHVIMGGKIVK